MEIRTLIEDLRRSGYQIEESTEEEARAQAFWAALDRCAREAEAASIELDRAA